MSSPSPLSQPSRIDLLSLETLEMLTKLSVIVVAALYGLGLIVSNQYLTSIGVSDFSSLRPKYLVTGTWTLLLLISGSLPVLFTTIVWRELTAELRKVDNKKFLLLTGIAIVAGVSIGILGGSLIIDLLGVKNRWFSFKESATLMAYVSLYAIICLALTEEPKGKVTAFFALLQLAVLVPAIAFMCANRIEKDLYALVPEALGGGKPVSGELVLNTEGSTFWRQIGSTSQRDAQSTTTGTIQILYQNEHELVVKAPFPNGKEHKQKLIVISKSLVNAVLISEESYQ